jgi:hypothetical protein
MKSFQHDGGIVQRSNNRFHISRSVHFTELSLLEGPPFIACTESYSPQCGNVRYSQLKFVKILEWEGHACDNIYQMISIICIFITL